MEDNNLVTLGYIKSLHEDNERNRRDLGINFYDESDDLVKNNQTNHFNDNIILNVQSIEINDECTSDIHAANKIYVDNIITHESLITNTRNNDMKGFNLTNVNRQVLITNVNKLTSKQGIINLTDNYKKGTHFVAFYENKYFDSFCIEPPKIISNQLGDMCECYISSHPIQNINDQNCGSYCLYFFDLKQNIKLSFHQAFYIL